MQWHHVYAPMAYNILLSGLVAALPVFFLIWALAIQRMKGHRAGLGTLGVAFIIALFVYRMPVSAAVSAILLGVVNGLFPIGYILLTSVFLYNLLVKAGQFDIIKDSIAYLSSDRRIQALLIAFAFSAFLEGAAGQGAPVAIAAAILIGMGFPPLMAAVVCLVANVPPVPFGPVGVPTIIMATVTEVNVMVLTEAVAMNCAVAAVIIAFATIWVMAGWKKTVEILPVILFTGVVYGVVSYGIAVTTGPTLPSVITPLVSLGTLALFLQYWQPKTIWRFAKGDASAPHGARYTKTAIFKAWSPILLVTLAMTIWGQPAFKTWLADAGWFFNVPSWPGLDGVVYRVAPIVSTPTPYAASFKWDLAGYAGTAMLLAIFVSFFILRINIRTAGEVFAVTLKQLGYSLLTVASFIGLAFLANYSGIAYTLGLAFAKTGALFPVFSPILGWLGVLLTGSVTASGALFGKLQQVTAIQLGFNPILTITANELGGSMGKLISPQSIAIVCAATGMAGRETDIFRAVLKYSVILLGVAILMILAQAYLAPGIVPALP